MYFFDADGMTTCVTKSQNLLRCQSSNSNPTIPRETSTSYASCANIFECFLKDGDVVLEFLRLLFLGSVHPFEADADG